MNQEAARWIKKLKLEKHPEGGYFKRTYESDMKIDIAGYDGPRHISTAIYYMLTSDDFDAFHRMKTDELWHLYAGNSLILYVIDRAGKMTKVKMGKGGTPQVVIKAGSWFAASVSGSNSYCLVGCTVSPGFDYRDWELGKREELVKMFPQHKKIIERHTRV